VILISEVGSYEAKTHLAEILREVEAGKSFTITRHGTPVAELVPTKNQPGRTAAEAIEELKEFRESNRLGPEISVKRLKPKLSGS